MRAVAVAVGSVAGSDSFLSAAGRMDQHYIHGSSDEQRSCASRISLPSIPSVSASSDKWSHHLLLERQLQLQGQLRAVQSMLDRPPNPAPRQSALAITRRVGEQQPWHSGAASAAPPPAAPPSDSLPAMPEDGEGLPWGTTQRSWRHYLFRNMVLPGRVADPPRKETFTPLRWGYPGTLTWTPLAGQQRSTAV